MPDLIQDDQLVLIKSGFFEVWLTRMARMFNQMENYVTFEDGSMIHRDELSVVYAVSIRSWEPASVAHLDAPSDWRPGGRGFNPAEVCNILSWRLIMKYFLRSFSPFR